MSGVVLLEGQPTGVPLLGGDEVSGDNGWWSGDWYSAPATREMPCSRGLVAPTLRVRPCPSPAPPEGALSLKELLTFHTQLPPEVCQEALLRLRKLRPRRALVCSLEGPRQLTVRAYHHGQRRPLELEQELSEWLCQALDSGRAQVSHQKDWRLCAPIRDRRGCVAGLAYAEGVSAGLAPQALERLLEWAQYGQTPARPQPSPPPQPLTGSSPPIAQREKATLFRSLSVMVASGVPLQRGLLFLSGSHRVGRLCATLSHDLSIGCSLSKAAARHPRVFSAVHVGMLRVSERAGQLHAVLDRLASYEEKQCATGLKLRSALTYPTIVLLLCLAGALLAPPFLLNHQFELIRELGLQAPWLTQLLMNFSRVMRTPWPYLGMVAGGALGLELARTFWKDEGRRLRCTELALKVPRLGALLRTLLQTQFARALAIQVESGSTMVEAVNMAGLACGNPLMVRVADQIGQSIYRGRRLAVSLQRTGFFSPLFLAVVQTGEEVGEIGKLTGWLADLGEQDLERSLEGVVALVEPVVMLVMGLVIGAMVLATTLPLARALEAF